MDEKCRKCNLNEEGKCLFYGLDDCDNAIMYCEYDEEIDELIDDEE